MKNNYITGTNKNYIQVRKSIGICNQSNLCKTTIYGPNAANLINKYSIRQIDKISNNVFYTLFLKSKKFINEVLIIKLSPIKFLLIYDESTSKKKNILFKMLNKDKKKFPLVTVENSTNSYSFFSFHGERANDYFLKNNSHNLYKVIRQGYVYYTILTSYVNKFSVLDHFKSLGFHDIGNDTLLTFFNNNGVITNLEKVLPKYRLSLFHLLYQGDNYKFKFKPIPLLVRQFEATKNFLVKQKTPILNSKRKKMGYIQDYYRLHTKKNPFLIGILKKAKYEKLALLKINKSEIIIKEYLSY